MGPVAVRQMRSGLKFISAIPAVSLREQANEVAREDCALVAQIQQVYWTVDLIEDWEVSRSERVRRRRTGAGTSPDLRARSGPPW